MNVRDVSNALAEIAPPELAEEWDNVGLIVGDPSANVRRLLLCIDLTPEAVEEARRVGAEMVMAYHPVIFRSVKSFTPDDAPIAWSAASAGLAVYSMHTALDVAPGGTNDVLAEILGLVDPAPLVSREAEPGAKLVVFVPPKELDAVRSAAFAAGAGRIGLYERCSFAIPGTGTFLPESGARPSVGEVGRLEHAEELRVEMVCPPEKVAAVLDAVREVHSYEEPAVDVYPTRPVEPAGGLGRIGDLDRPMPADRLIEIIKKAVGVDGVLVAPPADDPLHRREIARAACCAGSCGDAYHLAVRGGAQLYLTGEMRHHDALAAVREGLVCICVGHSNSERPTLRRLAGRIGERLDGLHVIVSEADRDPLGIA